MERITIKSSLDLGDPYKVEWHYPKPPEKTVGRLMYYITTTYDNPKVDVYFIYSKEKYKQLKAIRRLMRRDLKPYLPPTVVNIDGVDNDGSFVFQAMEDCIDKTGETPRLIKTTWELIYVPRFPLKDEE
jgi:hypothetical protein